MNTKSGEHAHKRAKDTTNLIHAVSRTTLIFFVIVCYCCSRFFLSMFYSFSTISASTCIVQITNGIYNVLHAYTKSNFIVLLLRQIYAISSSILIFLFPLSPNKYNSIKCQLFFYGCYNVTRSPTHFLYPGCVLVRCMCHKIVVDLQPVYIFTANLHKL